MASVGDENLGFSTESILRFSEMITNKLNHSESGMESLRSLIDAFGSERITHSVFSKSVEILFDNHKHTKQEGDDVSPVRAKVDESPKKSGDQVRVRVKIDENPKEDVSEGKKRRRIINHSEQRKSRRLDGVTPSYRLIPEEQRDPVSDEPELNCLNNKYSVMQFASASKHKQLSKYEEAIESCEEDMFETDMLMGALKSAVESAEKVLNEKMSVEDLGVKFYRCIEVLYRGDMSETVRGDHMTALPIILGRLKQKLDELTVAREGLKRKWKRVFEKNTRKQREATRRS